MRRSLLLLLFCFLLSPALASDSDHKYQADDPVTLWVNKVGPYNNPQETYNYYTLPFCHPPGEAGHKWGGLGEVLGGNELINSQIDIKYQKNVNKGTICELELDEDKVKQFKEAIENSYWFEFFMDDLPLWGFVGELHPDRNSDNKHVVYTHKNIIVQYNKDQIIHVNLTQENPKPLESGRILDMTYSVKWEPTNITFAHRFDVYLDYPFFEHQIHWFSIFNSFMMVIFLTGLVSMILMRTLRNDYAKYAREDDDLESMERDVNEESGWKLVHGDVFRPPRHLVVLSAVVGTGAQLALLILLVIVVAMVGTLYVGRGAIVTTFIVCYAFTSIISGYVSGGMYSRMGGKKWIKSMILTASLFPFLCFGIGFAQTHPVTSSILFLSPNQTMPENTIIVKTNDNQDHPSFPNPFISLFTNLSKFFNFPPPKSNPEPKVVETAPVAQNTKSKAPVVAAFPNKQTVPPLKFEAEDLERTTNPAVVWQVYAIGGFFVLKWAWARYNERRAKKKTNDEDPPPADE